MQTLTYYHDVVVFDDLLKDAAELDIAQVQLFGDAVRMKGGDHPVLERHVTIERVDGGELRRLFGRGRFPVESTHRQRH